MSYFAIKEDYKYKQIAEGFDINVEFIKSSHCQVHDV